MKLLLDENLSPRLSEDLAELFPGSLHVRQCGLNRADDALIWDYAKNNGLILVSKDSDFLRRSIVLGAPPKVIWVRIGNCPAAEVESLLRSSFDQIEKFSRREEKTCLALGQPRIRE